MNDLITFYYRAVDKNGDRSKIIKGTVETSTKAAAITKLESMNLEPVEVSEKDVSGLNKEINIGGKKKVKLKDIAIAVKQLSSMLDSGMPLIRALNAVEEQTNSKRLKEAFQEIARDVKAGSSLSAALATHSDIFPQIMIGMVKVGETGGFLSESLNSLANNLESDVELRGKIKGAMAYPVIVCIMAVIGISVMLLFVVPIFTDMFTSMGGQLPLPTRMMVAASNAMPYILPVVIALIIAFKITWPKLKTKTAVREVIDPIKLKMPVVGKVYHKILISRFATNMSTMLNSGVSLMEALSIVGETSGNIVLEKAIDSVANEVKAGKSISSPLAKHDIFPNLLTNMVAVGEESGVLEQMFQNVSRFYDQEVKTSTDQLTSMIEPLLIVFIGVAIGGMVIALYLPMFSMYALMNKQANS